MKFPSSFRVSFIFASLIAFCFIPTLFSKHHDEEHTGIHGRSSRSLLSVPPKAGTTTLVATLDGTMHLVEQSESGSTRVIWSFSTGSPIYQSYRALVKKDDGKENASAAITSGFMECGDDWSLYMYDEHFGKMCCLI